MPAQVQCHINHMASLIFFYLIYKTFLITAAQKNFALFYPNCGPYWDKASTIMGILRNPQLAKLSSPFKYSPMIINNDPLSKVVRVIKPNLVFSYFLSTITTKTGQYKFSFLYATYMVDKSSQAFCFYTRLTSETTSI